MLGFNLSVGRNRQSFGDADAQAFIAATGLTGTTETTAVRKLVANLKTYGLWSKMKAIYPFVSDTINLVSYSEDLSNGVYTNANLTVATNSTTAPDGTNTADRLTPTTFSGAHDIKQTITDSTSQCTYSVYLKANGYNYVNLNINDNVANGAGALFDLSNGTIVGDILIGSGWTVISKSITSAGNGWYRCVITINAAGSTRKCEIGPRDTNSTAWTYLFAGNNTSGIYAWGLQFQTGASVTTYQPIATTPANRFVSQFKYNLKDPRDLDAAFRLAFNGGWTYSKQGAKANGTNAYASTFFNGSLNQTTNSNAIGFYTNIANTSALSDPTSMGNVRTVDLNGSVITASGTSLSTRLNNNAVVGTISSAIGFFSASRQSATVTKIFSNTTQIATGNSGGVPINDTMLIANININGLPYAAGYVSNQFTFAYMADGLTDSDVSNYYTSVQTFQQDLSRQVGVPIVSDSDAQSFLNAAVITDTTQANAINTLVVGLKNASLWTKMKAIYPFVGGTATTHKWNLKDPRDLDAAYRLAFFGSWTHSSTGITGNGISTYAITYLNPSINLPSSQNSSIYLRTYATGGSSYPKQFAAQASPRFNYMGGANHLESYMGANTTVINDGTNTIGYFSAGGDNSLVYRKYRNNARITKADVYLGANTNMNIGDSQANFTTACNISFFNIGDSLTDSEISSVYTLVQNFQTTLGRQV